MPAAGRVVKSGRFRPADLPVQFDIAVRAYTDSISMFDYREKTCRILAENLVGSLRGFLFV